MAYSGTNAFNLAAIVAAGLSRGRVPVVISEHTPPSVFLHEAKWRALRVALMRAMYPRAATVAVPLAEVGDELKKTLRLPGLPVTVLPNPVLRGSIAGMKGAEPEIPLPKGPAPLLVEVKGSRPREFWQRRPNGWELRTRYSWDVNRLPEGIDMAVILVAQDNRRRLSPLYCPE